MEFNILGGQAEREIQVGNCLRSCLITPSCNCTPDCAYTAATDSCIQNCFKYKPTLSLLVYMFDLESEIVTIYFLFACFAFSCQCAVKTGGRLLFRARFEVEEVIDGIQSFLDAMLFDALVLGDNFSTSLLSQLVKANLRVSQLSGALSVLMSWLCSPSSVDLTPYPPKLASSPQPSPLPSSPLGPNALHRPFQLVYSCSMFQGAPRLSLQLQS